MLSYAIVPPQIDRSKPAHKQSDPTLYAGVVKERDDGIVIAGAQQLATGGVSLRLHPPELHPSAAAGRRELRQLRGRAGQCARPQALSAPAVRDSRARIPSTTRCRSRFDESDSYVIFDNVFVPWENVFIYRNLEVTRDQWWKTPSHLYGNHQAQVRYVTKLRFMIGLAKRMNEMTGNEANPAVQIMMGELAALVVDRRDHAAGARDDRADRERRAVAVEDDALFGDGAAIGDERADAGDDPRAGRAPR